VSFLVVAQSSSEFPEGLINNPVHIYENGTKIKRKEKGRSQSGLSISPVAASKPISI